MYSPPKMQDEGERLNTLRRYRVVDTPAEQDFDALVELAAEICGTPIAMVSLVAEDRQWFKARVGIEIGEFPRKGSFCGEAIHARDLFIVPDAREDARFTHNPLVLRDPYIRFYAGAPLRTPEGHALGALCVVDRKPRDLSDGQRRALRTLGRQVMAQLELRRRLLELREKTALTDDILDSLTASVAVLDAEGTIIRVNDAWQRFAQSNTAPAKRIEFVGMNYLTACEGGPHSKDADFAARARKGIRAVLAGAVSSFTLEYPCHSPTEQRWFTLRVTKLSGAHSGAVVAHEDITERVRAESISNQLAAIVTSSDDAIVGKDLSGIVTSWNHGAEKLYGYSAKEMFGTSSLRLTPHDRHSEERCLLEANRRGESVAHFETRGLRKDGASIDISITASPIRNAAGDVTGASQIVRDITERKRAEAAQKLFRSLVDSSIDTLEILDPKTGQILDVNAHGPAEIGCTREEYLRMSVMDLDPEIHDWPSRVEKIRRAGSWSGEGRHIRKDGSTFPVEVSARWVRLDRDYIVSVVRDITLRKQAESILRERDQQFRIYAEHSPVAVAMFDREMRYLVVSRRWREDYGLGDEPLIGRSHYEVFPELPERWKEVHLRCLSGATERCEEDEWRRPDGSLQYMRWEVRPWWTAEGAVGGLIIFGEDITNRKLSERALRESEERYHTVTHHMTEGLILSRLGTKQLHWNAAALAMHGLSEEEVRDLPGCARLFRVSTLDGEILPYEQWPMSRLYRGETLDELELRVSGIGAAWERVFRCNGAVVQEPSGEGLAFLTMTDITARHAAEQKIHEQAALLDKAQDAILVRDLEGRVTYWNKSAELLYGWTAEEALGEPASELLYHDPRDFQQATEAVIEKGEWIGEIEQYTRTDQKLIVQGRWTLVRDEHGQPKSILAINTDLTERKKLEQQFLRAQRMESIGTLAGGIAHDLNNVLGPILMSLDLLQIKFTDRESKEIIDVLSESARRGADMVRQVLSFARGLAGRRIEVQIAHLVRDIRKIAEETFLKQIEIRIGTPEDLWTVLGDATQLHQVMLNLCVNARDAMPHGGTLTISAENVMLDAQFACLHPEATPGPYVRLQVKDTGTGISPDILDKIFDPFFTTKEEGKGTGIGLSTTLAILKSHHGFVLVTSELARGTTFQVYLPAIVEYATLGRDEPKPEFPRGNGETVLVIDDEASVRQITQQTLEAFGYRVILACDGVEALSIYTRHRDEIAVVLTDMVMPVMDGPTIVQVLRRLNPRLPIMAASGLSTQDYVVRAATMGVKHFLPKPYTAEELLKTLKEVLATAAAP